MPAMLHQISPLHKEAQTESLWVRNDRTQQHAGCCAVATWTALKDGNIHLYIKALIDGLAAQGCCSHALSWETHFTEGCQKLLQGSSMSIQAVMIQRDTPPLGTAVAASRCDAI